MKYQVEFRELKAQNTDYHTWIKNGINFITNLPEKLTDCDFKEKQKIIGSIFPEKLQFDGKKVRTAFGWILRSLGNEKRPPPKVTF